MTRKKIAAKKATKKKAAKKAQKKSTKKSKVVGKEKKKSTKAVKKAGKAVRIGKKTTKKSSKKIVKPVTRKTSKSVLKRGRPPKKDSKMEKNSPSSKSPGKRKGLISTNTAKKRAPRRTSQLDQVPIGKVAQKVKKPRTKSDIFALLAQAAGLPKKDIVQIFDNLNDLITMDLAKSGPGSFNLPGLMKLVRVTKAATKARKGINPFTKEPMVYRAKPSRNVVKVRILKGLKEMVG